MDTESISLSGSAKKQVGLCPHCKAEIAAIIVETNVVRRDKCECPNCKRAILVCRTPGCDDYAKGTDSWDHELCPDCTREAKKIASETLSSTGTFAKELSKEVAKGIAPVIVAAILIKVAGKSTE